MFKKFDIKFLLGGMIALAIGVLTITRHVQQVIHFADPINELFFCAMAFMGGLVGLAASKK